MEIKDIEDQTVKQLRERANRQLRFLLRPVSSATDAGIERFTDTVISCAVLESALLQRRAMETRSDIEEAMK